MSDEFSDKLRDLETQFTQEYGEVKMLQANVAAINQLLKIRGKTENLYNALCSIIKTFKENRNE